MKIPELDRKVRAERIMKRLRTATSGMIEPASVTLVHEYGRDPFLVLVSCMLSLRTKDITTLAASRRLFSYMRTPQQLAAVPQELLERIIYPVGFYRQKAKQLHAMARMLIEQFGSTVPATEQQLLMLPGVGRKTANLVLAEGFGIPALCVDTHVHRIANRLGLIVTLTPEETERELKQLLSESQWAACNRFLVMWGQNICVPVSPKCSLCSIATLCERKNITRSR